MKINYQKGFTLIELLVVVLIIGILAAVALPQYQKTVEKSRLTEALTNIATVQKNVELYVLEHGKDGGHTYPENWAIALSGGEWINNRIYMTKYFIYDINDWSIVDVYRCQNQCTSIADMNDTFLYNIWQEYPSIEGNSKYCEGNSLIGSAICKSLRTQGWL